MSNRAWHLVARPTGLPTMENFALRELAREGLQDQLLIGRASIEQGL